METAAAGEEFAGVFVGCGFEGVELGGGGWWGDGEELMGR